MYVGIQCSAGCGENDEIYIHVYILTRMEMDSFHAPTNVLEQNHPLDTWSIPLGYVQAHMERNTSLCPQEPEKRAEKEKE